MGILDTLKKIGQTITPGGNKGYLEKKKEEAGVPSFTEKEISSGVKVPSGSRVVSDDASPSDAISGKKTRTVSDSESLRMTLDAARAKQGKGPASDEEFSMFERASGGPINYLVDTARENPMELVAGAAEGIAVAPGVGTVISAGISKVAAGLAARETIRIGASAANIAAKAAELGVSKSVLEEEILKITTREAAKVLAGGASKQVFTGSIKKALLYAGSTLIGGSGLATWLASDNAAGLASYQTTRIQGQFDNNELTKEEAINQIDGQINIIEKAKSFVNLNTMINPALWAFRKVFTSTVSNNLEIANNNKLLIETSPETTGDMYARLREEQDAKDAAFAEMQEKRDEAYKADKEKSDRESDIEFRERTLLFEAIRKRNAGDVLTQEMMALLIKYGLDTKIVNDSSWDDYGQSSLSFGFF